MVSSTKTGCRVPPPEMKGYHAVKPADTTRGAAGLQRRVIPLSFSGGPGQLSSRGWRGFGLTGDEARWYA